MKQHINILNNDFHSKSEQEFRELAYANYMRYPATLLGYCSFSNKHLKESFRERPEIIEAVKEGRKIIKRFEELYLKN